jgi:RNA-directed DNA polymerase
MLDDWQNPLGGGARGRIQFPHSYEDIISIENLLGAWREFVSGKRKRTDVQQFQRHLFDNIHALHCDLRAWTYRHGTYQAFKISDPKPRDIHKATVRDRLLHHALYRRLYPFFDRTWLADSFSCRKRKGTHRAMGRLRTFAFRASKNHTRTIWALKCDARKFFASIDQSILLKIVGRCVPDPDIRSLIRDIVESFQSNVPGKGLPLGNLTSQLLVNVYMNEFDQFVKHRLHAKYYVRYADDFVFLSHERSRLVSLIPQVEAFLADQLKLALHPDKVFIRTFASGVDFLGWVYFSDHRVLRTSTKRRMFKRIDQVAFTKHTVQSYVGLLRHGNAQKLLRRIITASPISQARPEPPG